jgi:hypothetical protein
MKHIHLAVAALLVLSAPSAALAQDRTIGGKSIPADQMAAVQDRCTELQAQQGTTGTQKPETSLDPQQAQGAMGAGGNISLDVSKITLQECIDGGFITQEDNAAQ